MACTYICKLIKKNLLVDGNIFSFFLSKINVTFLFLEDKEKKIFLELLKHGLFRNVKKGGLFFYS